MIKIKIISNPYDSVIEYEKDNGSGWLPIQDNSKLLEGNYTKGIFSFHVEKIVEIIISEFYSKSEKIEILFEGTDDEYDELVAICSNACNKGKVSVSKSERYLQNARDIVPDMIGIFNKKPLQNLIGTYFPNHEEIQKEKKKFESVAKNEIPICIMGNYSAGKSTFINALTGCEVLPSSAEPMTAKIHVIRNSKSNDTAEISFGYNGSTVKIKFVDGFKPEIFWNEGRNSSLCKEIGQAIKETLKEPPVYRVNKVLQVINHSSEEKLSDTIILKVPFNKNSLFGSNGQNFVIFDTPGSNTASNKTHFAVLKKALERFSNGLPIYISATDNMDSKDNEELCNQIKSIPELDSRFTMIIVNKAENTFDANPQTILNQAIFRELSVNRLYLVSSIIGLGAKTNGKFFNGGYEERFEEIKNKFSNSDSKFYKQLYLLDILPEHKKTICIQESQECPNLMLANSGLYWIEREILTFAEKYSAYNKCCQLERFLSKTITIARKELQEIRQQHKKTEQILSSKLDDGKAKLLNRLETEKNAKYQEANDKYLVECEQIQKQCQEQLEKGKITVNNLKETENTLNSLKKKEYRTKKGLDNAVADELLEMIKKKFASLLLHLIQEVYHKSSENYWKQYEEIIKKSLLAIVSGSTDVNERKKQELSSLIQAYPNVQLPSQTDNIFKKENLKKSFKLFGITLWNTNQLDIEKIADIFNSELLKISEKMIAQIQSEHKQAFVKWLEELIKNIRDNITDMNPYLRELSEKIRQEQEIIWHLEDARNELRKYTEDVKGKVNWKYDN